MNNVNNSVGQPPYAATATAAPGTAGQLSSLDGMSSEEILRMVSSNPLLTSRVAAILEKEVTWKRMKLQVQAKAIAAQIGIDLDVNTDDTEAIEAAAVAAATARMISSSSLSSSLSSSSSSLVPSNWTQPQQQLDVAASQVSPVAAMTRHASLSSRNILPLISSAPFEVLRTETIPSSASRAVDNGTSGRGSGNSMSYPLIDWQQTLSQHHHKTTTRVSSSNQQLASAVGGTQAKGLNPTKTTMICPPDLSQKQMLHFNHQRDLMLGVQMQQQQQQQQVLLKQMSSGVFADGGGVPPKASVQDHQRKYVDEPSDLDVISGRGGKSNHHPGNKRYRQLIKDMKAQYKTIISKSDKTDLSRAIVDHVYRYGGRFLRRVDLDRRGYDNHDDDDHEDAGSSNNNNSSKMMVDSDSMSDNDDRCTTRMSTTTTTTPTTSQQMGMGMDGYCDHQRKSNNSNSDRKRKGVRYIVLTPAEARKKTSQSLREKVDAKWTM
jgi:hypothetical protein